MVLIKTAQNVVEALLSSLGAFKCIVARCFAEAYNIDLQNLKIELEGDLDPSGFMGKNPDVKIDLQLLDLRYILSLVLPRRILKNLLSL